MDSSLKGRDLMKEIPKMYMLYFFGNSLSYLLMDSLRGSVIDKNHVMASKTYANFVLIAVLTVVSVIADSNSNDFTSFRSDLICDNTLSTSSLYSVFFKFCSLSKSVFCY